MCETGRVFKHLVCADACRKHLWPLPYDVADDGEPIRVKVARRLEEIAEMGLCGAQIDDLEKAV